MAAKAKASSNVNAFRRRPRKKRPGVHSKKTTAKGKSCKNYKKVYRGQGR